MTPFTIRFALGTALGGFVALGCLAATGESFYWMPPVVGLVYGTLRAMHDESDTV